MPTSSKHPETIVLHSGNYRKDNATKTGNGQLPWYHCQIEIIARNIRKIGGGIVLLTGGEPFLRKDLPEIVEIFKKNKFN